MNEGKTLRKFIIAMTTLGVSLVLIWCFFFFFTLRNVRKNAEVQSGVQSEAIMSRIEDELQSVEEISYYLAHNAKAASLCQITDSVAFFDYGGEVSEAVETIIRGDNPVSDIIIMGQSGLYYRLKGNCPNTVLTRIQNILNGNPSENFFVNGSGATYIGTSGRIRNQGREVGQVILLIDKTKLEYIFSDYSGIDYMGIVLMSSDQILCSNKNIKMQDITQIKKDSVVYKEQPIGLTDLNLLVYCENAISADLKGYFYIALPVMIIILAAIISFYTYYWNKTALGPQERKLMESKMKVQEIQLENERTLTGLLKKQISAHFTVNTLTAVRSLINKGEKEKAAHLCDELSWLLRYSNSPDELISLMEEYRMLNQYIGIMSTRYPGRIEYNADIEDYFEDIYIPRMILQPIIENSIVHGLSGKEKISISLKTQLSGDLFIYLNDDGCGIDKARLAEINRKIKSSEKSDTNGIKGIALVNIRKRIQIACGENYGIKIESVIGQGTNVTVHLKKLTSLSCEDMQCTS